MKFPSPDKAGPPFAQTPPLRRRRSTREMMFKSFWMGGFECSTHRRRDGRRLDLIGSTGHDRFAAPDYARLRAAGLLTVREGLRWHLCDRGGGRFDFSSVLPQLRAARAAGVQVIWDLCHYGWPDGLDIWQPELVDRFAAWARAVARLLASETDDPPLYVPINEISFWSWAGGEVGLVNPSTLDRGFELKVQLVRAALAGVAEVRSVDRRARLLFAEPAIHITSATSRPRDIAEAEGHRLAQFQVFDMLAGRLWPQLGGEAGVLDLRGGQLLPAQPVGAARPHHPPRRAGLPALPGDPGRGPRALRPPAGGERDRRRGRRPCPLAGVCGRRGEGRAARRCAGPGPLPLPDLRPRRLGRRPLLPVWPMGLRRCPRRTPRRPRARPRAGLPAEHHRRAAAAARHQPGRGPVPRHRLQGPDWHPAWHLLKPSRPTSRRRRPPSAPAPARVADPGWERGLDRASDRTPDLVCLSHLRWDFVTQRPQHLMSRFARDRRVFFVEEPVLLPEGEREPRLALHRRPEGVQVALPHLPPGLSAEQTERLWQVAARAAGGAGIDSYVLWYYTPMALPLDG